MIIEIKTSGPQADLTTELNRVMATLMAHYVKTQYVSSEQALVSVRDHYPHIYDLFEQCKRARG